VVLGVGIKIALLGAFNAVLVMPAPLLPVDSPVATDGFRCETNRLVELGDSTSDVLGKCGPPASQVVHRGRWGSEELWTYDQGPTEFLRILQFDSRGLLTKIMLGGYGR
jgi:hypothetical protein